MVVNFGIINSLKNSNLSVKRKTAAIYFRGCIISANKVEIILSDCSIILTKAGEQKWMSI